MSTPVLERDMRVREIPPSMLSVSGADGEERVVRSAYVQARQHYMFPITRQRTDLFVRYRGLLQNWIDETKHVSSYEQIVMNRHYQAIIGMGPIVIPLLLRELARAPLFLFPALYSLTDVNPVPEEHEGDVEAMASDWIRWGREEGYLGAPY